MLLDGGKAGANLVSKDERALSTCCCSVSSNAASLSCSSASRFFTRVSAASLWQKLVSESSYHNLKILSCKDLVCLSALPFEFYSAH